MRVFQHAPARRGISLVDLCATILFPRVLKNLWVACIQQKNQATLE